MKLELFMGTLNITPLAQSITWSGDVTQLFRKLEVSLLNTKDGQNQWKTFEKGSELTLNFTQDEQTSVLFKGYIFADSIDVQGSMTITAYDSNIYLTKYQDTKKFQEKKASDIIRELCREIDVISVGQIEDTGYIIPKLILRNKTLWAMMKEALEETKNHTGREFVVSSQDGKFFLKEHERNRVQWALESGVNIISASHAQSIEDLRNVVKVVSGDENKDPIEVTKEDQSLISKYNKMQHFESAGNDQSRSKMQQLATQLLSNLGKIKHDTSVEALGNIEVIAGTTVQVTENMTDMQGNYYVTTDSHTFADGFHNMSLTITQRVGS
ncbi:XkdQ/YqbQ family protein [Longirhabdus pacifica]|uniref:XkdQ/YqbQ family protein n=1 Tax=Longirhabdus pacifica TaxID=2305227 RepID=UPI0010091889|nr:hypothetical protein [Longirhabdus pacifica]